jgi:O-antigen/teichoic acid export membrane protein
MLSYLKAFGARVFAIASNLVCGLIALKLYGHLAPEAYGVVVVALTIMGYLPLLDGGFRTTVNRAILAERTSNERRALLQFGQVFYAWLGLAVVAAALLLMLGYSLTPTGRASGQPLSFFVALAFGGGLSVISSIQAGVLLGLEAQASLFLVTALGSWLNLATLWLVLKQGGGVWAFPIATLVSVAGVYPTALWLIHRKESWLPFFPFVTGPRFWEYFKRLRRDAWHCFQSQVSIVFLYTIDIILVGFLCSAREAAIYGVLSRMFAILRGFLQAMSEISWPLIAKRGWANQRLNRVLNRMNAWAVGSVTGALALTLAPFCGWFIGEAWSVPPWLVWLMAARFMITSFAAPAAYLLYGAGEFRAISRYLNRELAVGLVLAIGLGAIFGLAGVAWAFLVSTAVGTLYPIFRAYAAKTGESMSGTLLDIWARGAAGLTISLLCTNLTLGSLATGGQLVLAGAIGVAGGLAACVAWSSIRMLRDGATVAPGTVLKFINSI